MWRCVCSLLARVGKKRTKETPLKGEEHFKTRQGQRWLEGWCIAEFFAIPSPLRIPLPSFSARGERCQVGCCFRRLPVEICEVEFGGGARGCGLTGFALELMCYSLGDGLARGLTRLQDVRGDLMFGNGKY